MCHKYSSEDISRNNCIRKCIDILSWDSKRKCRKQLNVIIIDDIDRNISLCPKELERHIEYFGYLKQCQKQCPVDCYNEDYDIKIHTEKDFQYVNDDGSNWSDVTILHQTKADILITHTTEINFSNFIASLGGLAGIYLGISVLALYDHILTFIAYIIRRNTIIIMKVV